MKLMLISVLLYLALTVFFYLLICCIGLIWFKWHNILYCPEFNIIYWLFVGWWIGIPFATEYYAENE